MVCTLSLLPFSFQVVLWCWLDLSYPCVPSMLCSNSTHTYQLARYTCFLLQNQPALLSLSHYGILFLSVTNNSYWIKMIQLQTFNTKTQSWWLLQLTNNTTYRSAVLGARKLYRCSIWDRWNIVPSGSSSGDFRSITSLRNIGCKHTDKAYCN